MKRALIATTLAVVVSLSLVYIIIPAELKISETNTVRCNLPAARRFIFEQSNWPAWFQVPVTDENSFSHKVTNSFFSKTDIELRVAESTYTSTLVLIPFNADSTGIEWSCLFPTSSNPFARVQQYFKARELKKHMESMTAQMVNFLQDKTKVYGTPILKVQLPDRPLMSRRVFLDHPPSPEEAYELISSVENFVTASGDSVLGPAMKYSAPYDSARYELMVAVPTRNMLKKRGDFIAKGLVGGNLIATEVKGGEAAIEQGWKGLRQYKADYQLSSPAIPFEMMITDRRAEPDSNKWVTRIYYPIRF